jgi:hypothetical protein
MRRHESNLTFPPRAVCARLRSMPPSRARQLILAYAGVLVLLNLSILLPGNPDFASGWKGTAASLAIQALIVWRLWHRSPLAWGAGVAFPLLALVALVLMAATIEVGTLLLIVFSVAQIAILCTAPLRAFIWSPQGSGPSLAS